MKKSRIFFFSLLLILSSLVCLSALGEEAKDMTDMCRLTTSGGKYKNSRLFDRKYRTTWISYQEKHPFVAFEAPENEKIGGVYVCFGDKVKAWEVQAQKDGVWQTVFTSENEFAHQYVPLDGVSAVRVQNSSDKSTILNISEIYIFSQGDAPAFVQNWHPTLGKADLLVISAHPDDEMLFFGGAIPYYAAEVKKDVLVAYMTCGTAERRSELLDGLWTAGIRNYPVIGDFWDKYSKRLETGYEAWGKTATWKFVTELYRTHQPEVVLTHDVNGEYGHGAHRVCADAAMKCIEYAADNEKWPDLGEAWQVKKLYLHLYPENPIVMDWDQPMENFGGLTGYEVALRMFDCHPSQHEAGQKNKETGKFERFSVEKRESDYSCYEFGLAFTSVGNDVKGTDFFENIPE